MFSAKSATYTAVSAKRKISPRHRYISGRLQVGESWWIFISKSGDMRLEKGWARQYSYRAGRNSARQLRAWTSIAKGKGRGSWRPEALRSPASYLSRVPCSWTPASAICRMETAPVSLSRGVSESGSAAGSHASAPRWTVGPRSVLWGPAAVSWLRPLTARLHAGDGRMQPSGVENHWRLAVRGGRLRSSSMLPSGRRADVG